MQKRSTLSNRDEIFTLLMNSSVKLRSRVDFGPGVRKHIARILRQINAGDKVLLLSQKSIPERWLLELYDVLSGEGFKVFRYNLPDGEEAKSTLELLKCWELLQNHEFTRVDSLVAVGGGSVSDLGGFCASTYLRGINLLLIPTTVLAQVDAGIGGKTAINLASGKNLLGSFYFPASVLVDPEYLQTLNERDFKSGMAEIAKYAFIESTVAENSEYRTGPRPLFDALYENFRDGINASNPFFSSLISICIRMKLSVVLQDPFEERLRRCLNLGHTLGHGLEKLRGKDLSHGEAVAIGTVFAFKLAVSKDLIASSELEKAENLLSLFGLPLSLPANLNPDELLQFISRDKKRSGDAIRFVLPEKSIGRVNLDTGVSLAEIAEFLKDSCN